MRLVAVGGGYTEQRVAATLAPLRAMVGAMAALLEVTSITVAAAAALANHSQGFTQRRVVTARLAR